MSAKRRVSVGPPGAQAPAHRKSDTAQYRPLDTKGLNRLVTLLQEKLDKRGDGQPVVLALSEAYDVLNALRNSEPRKLTAKEIRDGRAAVRKSVAEIYLEYKEEHKNAGKRDFAKRAMSDTREAFPALTEKAVNHHVAQYLNDTKPRQRP